MGVAVPRDLMNPTEDNPRGYWESRSLMALHERILSSMQMRWFDTERLPDGWQSVPEISNSKVMISAFLEEQFPAEELFLLKDPRMCRLIPLWVEVLESIDVDIKIVIPVRHPLEVASSLARRDDLLADSACLLCLRHLLEAECATRDLDRSFVQYSQLLEDPARALNRISKDLGIRWPNREESRLHSLADSVDSRLRHHVRDTEVADESDVIASSAQRVYRAMLRLCEDQQDGTAQDSMDAERGKLNQADQLYVPTIRERRNLANAQAAQLEESRLEISQNHREIDQKHAELEELAGWAHDLESSKQNVERQLEESRLEISQNHREIDQKHAELEELAGWAHDLESSKQNLGLELYRTKQALVDAGKQTFIHRLRGGVVAALQRTRVWFDATLLDKKVAYAGPELQRAAVVFDSKYYRAGNPDLDGLSEPDLLQHYLNHGWKEHRNPNEWFNTAEYLEWFPELRHTDTCPLVDFVCQSGGATDPGLNFIAHRAHGYHPRISAIVPNYNHGPYLAQRIESITSQTRPPAELIILDDASTDGSQEEINRLVETVSIPTTVIVNDENSGNVFRQWRRGIDAATSELIWICESDDYCDIRFLEKLTHCFADQSIKLAFGNIQFADSSGSFMEGMDDYREGAQPGIWSTTRVDSAVNWFQGAFGHRNVLANVGGGVFRKQNLGDEVWAAAEKYDVCGDWYLYMHLAQGGRILYEPEAVAYFRQHDTNRSVTSFQTESFYREHAEIARELRRLFGCSDAQTRRYYELVRNHFESVAQSEVRFSLEEVFDLESVLGQQREARHILMGVLGFSTGGGEMVPINLANELAARGRQVSFVCVDSRANEQAIRSRLDTRVAVYERELVDELGVHCFLREHGFDLIHTHFLGVDLWLHQSCSLLGLPYVVTHHGSYDCEDIGDDLMRSLIDAVDHWVYIADKNLDVFKEHHLADAVTTKLPNAVPESDGSFRLSRSSLNISESTLVFGLASRAMYEKGWAVAASAVGELNRKNPELNARLLLCGNGSDYEALRKQLGRLPWVQLLGYQSDVIGFYRICDCCVFPTRFAGESYPLTLLEAMAAGIPSIATSIGEVPAILGHDKPAGCLIDYSDDDRAFTANCVRAMEKMLDADYRQQMSENVLGSTENLKMDSLTDQYEDIYQSVMTSRARNR